MKRGSSQKKNITSIEECIFSPTCDNGFLCNKKDVSDDFVVKTLAHMAYKIFITSGIVLSFTIWPQNALKIFF